MSELDKLRFEINDIDNNIMDLLVKRMSISKKIGEFKKNNNMKVFDPSREKLLLERLISCNKLEEDFIKDLWDTIMKYSKGIQKN